MDFHLLYWYLCRMTHCIIMCSAKFVPSILEEATIMLHIMRYKKVYITEEDGGRFVKTWGISVTLVNDGGAQSLRHACRMSRNPVLINEHGHVHVHHVHGILNHARDPALGTLHYLRWRQSTTTEKAYLSSRSWNANNCLFRSNGFALVLQLTLSNYDLYFCLANGVGAFCTNGVTLVLLAGRVENSNTRVSAHANMVSNDAFSPI